MLGEDPRALYASDQSRVTHVVLQPPRCCHAYVARFCCIWDEAGLK